MCAPVNSESGGGCWYGDSACCVSMCQFWRSGSARLTNGEAGRMSLCHFRPSLEQAESWMTVAPRFLVLSLC